MRSSISPSEIPARVRFLTPSRRVAASALMCALLLVVQFVLSFVPGVELVTALFLSFCVLFGARAGVLTATAFSLLRCFLFGFTPSVIVLYLVYFNAFALFFGFLGTKRLAAWLCPALLALLAGGTLCAALVPMPVSALELPRIRALAWVLFGVLCALFALWAALLRRGEAGRRTAAYAAFAALFTVLFTLLDDVLTPLIYGWTAEAALAYFYTGFLAMLPQTACAAVSVALLYPVLARIFLGRAQNAPQTLDE